MNDNTPGNYNGMTHADAKKLQREVREQLLDQEAREFVPINRRVIVIVLDDDDGSASVGVTCHRGAHVEVEFAAAVPRGDAACSIGYLTGQIRGIAGKGPQA